MDRTHATVRRTLVTLALLALVALPLAFAQNAGGNVAQGDNVKVQMLAKDGQFYFDPVGLHVKPGTTITFVNVGQTQHCATSYTPDNGVVQQSRIPDGADSWDSGLLGDGQTFQVKVTKEGVYDFYCTPHRALGMVGRIVVGDPSASPAKPLDGLSAKEQANMPSVDAILSQDDGLLTWQEAQGQQ